MQTVKSVKKIASFFTKTLILGVLRVLLKYTLSDFSVPLIGTT